MPRVEFLVAGSPDTAFFSQVAANRISVFSQNWSSWQPTYRAVFGGEPDWRAMAIWMPQLRDIDVEFLSTQRFAKDGYFAQAERRINPGLEEADVFVLLDADTFIIGNLEEVLEDVHEKKTIAGVQAHVGFTGGHNRVTREDWQALADQFIGKPMRFGRRYIVDAEDATESQRDAPFYINAGFIVISRDIVNGFYRTFVDLRRQIEPLMKRPYLSAQVALTLTIESLGIDPISLPLRYNYANNPITDTMYPDELSDIRVFHFRRRDRYNRWEIFASPEAYDAFLSMPLDGCDRVFQDSVRKILGEQFPFRAQDECIRSFEALLRYPPQDGSAEPTLSSLAYLRRSLRRLVSKS